ncbi:MFS transporter, partial [Myxococcota bacterium]|nr:MFS transporter [Myxococcota bacterium]
STGYFATAFVNDYWMVFLTLGIMAVGSGLFKPIISGTIARTTDEKTSGFGFGVYYWMINMGALVAPLVIYYLRGISWKYVFIFSGCATATMFIPTLFLYKDPDKPESSKNIKEVLRGAVTVLSDSRFMLMVFVYSMFWILYFQNFGTVLWYLRDFIDPTPVNNFFASMGVNYSFRPEHVTVINAGTIVLLQVLISYLTKKTRPLPTMMTGMFIGSLGFLFLALSSNVWVFIAGIAVFSVGEMTCHPKYVSYIGLIAPSDKKAIYMGYAFIYGVIGSLVGSNVGGELYDQILTPLASGCTTTGVTATLRSFWLTFGVLGLFSMGGLFIFHKFFGKDSQTTRLRARRVMVGAYTLFVLIGVLFIGTRIYSVITSVRSVSLGHIPTAVTFAGDGKSLFSGGWRGNIEKWDVHSGDLKKTLPGCKCNTLWSIEYAPRVESVITATKTGQISRWSVVTGKMIDRDEMGKQDIWAARTSVAGVLQAIEGTRHGLKIWDVKSHKLLAALEGKAGKVMAARFHPTKETIITGSDDGTVRVWDISTGQIIRTLIGHSAPVVAVAFGLKKYAASASGNEIILWDYSTNRKLSVISLKNIGITYGGINSLAVSPDEALLAMGREDGTITVWNIAQNTLARNITKNRPSGGLAEKLKKSAKTFLQALILITIGLLGLWAGRGPNEQHA